jgi:hypothetical protein
VALALVGLTALTAIAVHLVAADAARQQLGFTFEGLPRRVDQALAIFANNVRVLGAVLAACVAVQVAARGPDAGWEALLLRTVTAVCDAAVIVGCAVHVLVIGAAVGAYGERTLWMVLAHGPFELAAFSLALALYLAGRRERLPAGRLLAVALAATAALAVGALLEVYA